jgi:hypothetical protein
VWSAESKPWLKNGGAHARTHTHIRVNKN